jgi:hypothetical protein
MSGVKVEPQFYSLGELVNGFALKGAKNLWNYPVTGV